MSFDLLLRQEVLPKQQPVNKKDCFFLPKRQFVGMNNPATQFREWMDSKELRAKDVAKRFGVSEQTISHWRSQGVPDRRQPHVNYVIACWEKPTAAELGTTLLLKPTSGQFNAWNEAWRHSKHTTLEQWAIQGLDKLAESDS